MLFQLHFHESTYFWCVNFPIRFRLLWFGLRWWGIPCTVAVRWDRGMRPVIFTSEGPKEMSQQIGRVLSDCKTAEHDQSLGFNSYPPALQLQISLLRDHEWAAPLQCRAFSIAHICIWRTWLWIAIKNIFYSCDWISCCLEALHLSNGLLLPVGFELKQMPQRLFWPQRSMWRKSEKDNLAE